MLKRLLGQFEDMYYKRTVALILQAQAFDYLTKLYILICREPVQLRSYRYD